MKIVIDVFGADMPEEIVKGAITSVNLIEEVEIILTGDKDKIQKVIDKELPEADKEVLLVIDGTTGQNAISQVKTFKETVDITGIVLTKMDGTAKGGVVLGIVDENKIPIKYIGVGEQIDDMEKFDAKQFVEAII